jgi:hypothetical protein
MSTDTRKVARTIASRFTEFDGCAQAHLADAIDEALRNERERSAKIAETDTFAPVDYGGLCHECEEWTPPRHPERGEHKESCSWSWVHGKEFKGDRRIAAAIRRNEGE